MRETPITSGEQDGLDGGATSSAATTKADFNFPSINFTPKQ